MMLPRPFARTTRSARRASTCPYESVRIPFFSLSADASNKIAADCAGVGTIAWASVERHVEERGKCIFSRKENSIECSLLPHLFSTTPDASASNYVLRKMFHVSCRSDCRRNRRESLCVSTAR